jgi:competence protein ComEC
MLATGRVPVMVIQTPQESLLINSGPTKTVEQILLPFLRRQGIRRIDHAIATAQEGRLNGGLGVLAQQIPIRQLWDGGTVATSGPYVDAVGKVKKVLTLNATSPLVVGQPLPTSSYIQLQALETNPVILSLITQPQSQHSSRWLLLGTAPPNAQIQTIPAAQPFAPIDWVWWDGGPLSTRLIQQLQIKGAIGSGGNSPEQEDPWSPTPQRPLYWTDQEGAVFWTSREKSITTHQDQSDLN